MDSSDLGRLLATFEREAFRLQRLPRYHLGDDEHDFEMYLTGRPLPDREGHPWIAELARLSASGRSVVNVHVLPARMTPYLQYTLDWWYAYWSRAGADIRFIATDVAGTAVEGLPDFWMFDAQLAVDMHYDDRGVFVGSAIVTGSAELDRRKQARQLLVDRSVRIEKLYADLRAGRMQ